MVVGVVGPHNGSDVPNGNVTLTAIEGDTERVHDCPMTPVSSTPEAAHLSDVADRHLAVPG
jgi:hypothetical protein